MLSHCSERKCCHTTRNWVIITGKLVGVVKDTIGIVEPNIKFAKKTGVLVAKALVD